MVRSCLRRSDNSGWRLEGGFGGWLLSPVTWPVCAGGVPVSAEAPGRFQPTATFSGHTGVIRG